MHQEFTTIEREQFAEFKQRYLRQIAYMSADLAEWAEKNGGIDALTTTQKNQYKGRENGLIVLANYDDAATDFIQYLENRVEALAIEVRHLKDKIGAHESEAFISKIDWIRSFAGATKEPQALYGFFRMKEAKRASIINFSKQSQPELY